MGWLIYLIGIVDDVKMLLVTIFFCSIILHGIAILCVAIAHEKLIGNIKKNLLVLLIEVFIGLISVLIPSSKTIAAIYLIPSITESITENKQVQQIPEKALKLFNLKLDAWITDLASDAIKTKKEK